MEGQPHFEGHHNLCVCGEQLNEIPSISMGACSSTANVCLPEEEGPPRRRSGARVDWVSALGRLRPEGRSESPRRQVGGAMRANRRVRESPIPLPTGTHPAD